MRKPITVILALILALSTVFASAESINMLEQLRSSANKDFGVEAHVYESLYSLLSKANGGNLPLNHWDVASTYISKLGIGEELTPEETIFDQSLSAYEKYFLKALTDATLPEEDEMLNMGFVKDVTKIIEATPSDRQLVLFSATTNQDVLTIAWKYQHDPVEVTVEATKKDRPQITQYVISVEQNEKTDHLMYLLDANVYGRVMVFCNTKFMTDKLTKQLVREGYDAQCLHGDIPQAKRNVVMNDFKRGKFPILVSTDVAARGIDVDDVEAVINYDLPNENEYYLHRIGRTGRAHKHGVSFSLVTFRESVRMDEILKYMLTKPTPLKFEDGILKDEEGQPFFAHI